MLRELAVQNLAVIEDVRVELAPGFCAWTGETGAGKSLLLGALGLLLGERASPDLIRTGADELRVTGRFELARADVRRAVEDILGEPAEEVILARRVRRDGKGAAYVNDQPAAVATLKRLGEVLVDVHGQRDSQSLLQPGYQLLLLDAFGRLDDLRAAYRDAAGAVRELRRRRTALLAERHQRQRELALVRFEREELDAADLKPGELTALTQERERLLHAQSLQTFAAEAAGTLYDEEGSIVEKLGHLQKEAGHWSALDARLGEAAARLAALISEVQDLADTYRDLGESFEADPGRLYEADRRFQTLRRLEAKYGRPADELSAYAETLAAKETELQRQEDDLGAIDAALHTAFAKLRSAAAALGQRRAKVAKQLATAAQKHLTDLGMPGAKLTAELEPVPLGDDPADGDLPADGTERLELLLAANPGEPARPLRKVASGGELSRAMLALKSVLAEHDPVSTLIFDEIDANVGGRLGDVLGRKLAALGKTHQVICVTHLPQVASFAAGQWTIRKQPHGKRTVTTIRPLQDDAARLDELANMLRGAAQGETTREEVKAMLAAARKSGF